MFKSRDDFKQVDVSRLTDAALAMGILPQRPIPASMFLTAKDVAFLFEALREFYYLAWDDDILDRIRKNISPFLGVVSYPSGGGYVLDGITTAFPIRTSWCKFDGIDISRITNKVFYEPKEGEDFGEDVGSLYGDWKEAVYGKDSAALIHVPRDRRGFIGDGGGYVSPPFVFPKECVYDLFYVCQEADGMIVPSRNYLESKIDTEMEKEIVTRESVYDEETEKWTEKPVRVYKNTTDSIAYRYSQNASSSQRYESIEDVVEISGEYTLKYRARNPELIEEILCVFRGIRTALSQTQIGNGTIEDVERDNEWQFHVVKAEPYEYDEQNETVTFKVKAIDVAGCISMLSKTPPSMPSGDFNSTYVTIIASGVPTGVVFRYKRRTSIKDLDWDYKPNDDVILK
jgi:hypothetical protein